MLHVAKVGALCVVALTALALHGCTGDFDEATVTVDGASFEEATSADLSTAQVDAIRAAATDLAADSTSSMNLAKIKDAFKAILGNVMDDSTAVAIEGGNKLEVLLVLKPIMLANGKLKLTRSDNDDSGPVFHFVVPIVNNQADLSGLNAQLMKSGMIHIEGFLRAIPFTEGGFKLTTDKQGKKFELLLQQVKFFNIISAEATLSVADDNKVTAEGSAKNWFDTEMTAKVVQAIQEFSDTLIQQFKQALQDANIQLENYKPNCDFAQGLLDPINCAASTLAYNAAKALMGADIVDAISNLLMFTTNKVTDLINTIFQINTATFNLVLDPEDTSGSMELNLAAKVFGIDVGPHKIVIDTKDIQGFVDKIIQQFAPLIYALKTRRDEFGEDGNADLDADSNDTIYDIKDGWKRWAGSGITYHGWDYSIERYCKAGAKPVGDMCWRLATDNGFKAKLQKFCARTDVKIAFGHPDRQKCGECSEVRVKRRGGGYNYVTVMTTDVPGTSNSSPELSDSGKKHLDQNTANGLTCPAGGGPASIDCRFSDRLVFDYRPVPCIPR